MLPDDDSLAIASNSGNNIQIISANGALRRNLGSRGDGPGQFLGPVGLACDGEALYVMDYNHRLQKLSLEGKPLAICCEYRHRREAGASRRGWRSRAASSSSPTR